jgi:aminoglycoside phosphotransferase (APT) family kinase protein
VLRLDTGLVLRELADTAGLVLTWDGACPGGQVGASYVRWPDGHRSVLTWQPAGDAASARQACALLEVARTSGVPAPRYELVQEVPSAVVIVQELLPGRLPTALGRRTVESMVALNRRCRGLLADRHDLPAPSLYLLTDGPGFCLHEPLARYGRRTAALLAQIHEIGAAGPEQLSGDDLVHLDFHPENVLIDEAGTVTGVVDWDAIGRGNGDFDLITLRFDLARRAPDLGRRLGEQLADHVPEEVARVCWAHMSLRLVDWSIRHLTPADVNAWLDVAETLRP